jgi:RNA polymerase sigma-70 factor, ECF subfamily
MSTREPFNTGPVPLMPVLTSGFRRKATLDEAPAGLVSRAVRAARDGDRDALRYLYVRFADNIYGYVCSIVRDEHEAEDITQQVFTKLTAILPNYQERDVPFSAWILRVARNLALDHLRQRRAVPCEEIRGADEHFDDTARERSQCLQEALSILPPDQREVLIMRHIMGMSPKEIACSLGKSEGSIHGLHHRGRGAMQRALIELESAPATAGSNSA